jgi:hypothetical protein
MTLKWNSFAASVVVARQNGADMPQFFFHLTNGDTVRDEVGTRCDTLEDAREFALAVAAELGRNRSAAELEALALSVTDQSGREVFRTKLVNMQHSSNADAMIRAARGEER